MTAGKKTVTAFAPASVGNVAVGFDVLGHALEAIGEVARRHGLPVHMDGARFANAIAALGCTPAEMTWKRGVTALSLGATKNGCLGVEAVVGLDAADRGVGTEGADDRQDAAAIEMLTVVGGLMIVGIEQPFQHGD